MAVATIAQTTAAEYPSQTMCRRDCFRRHPLPLPGRMRSAPCRRIRRRDWKYQLAFAKDQFRPPSAGRRRGCAAGGSPRRIGTMTRPAQGIKRDGILLERVGARLCRSGRWARWKLIAGTGVSFGIRPVTLSALYALQTEKMALAAHLAAQRSRRTQIRIGPLMQCHPIPDPMLANDGGKPLAGVRKVGLQPRQAPLAALATRTT